MPSRQLAHFLPPPNEKSRLCHQVWCRIRVFCALDKSMVTFRKPIALLERAFPVNSASRLASAPVSIHTLSPTKDSGIESEPSCKRAAIHVCHASPMEIAHPWGEKPFCGIENRNTTKGSAAMLSLSWLIGKGYVLTGMSHAIQPLTKALAGRLRQWPSQRRTMKTIPVQLLFLRMLWPWQGLFLRHPPRLNWSGAFPCSAAFSNHTLALTKSCLTAWEIHDCPAQLLSQTILWPWQNRNQRLCLRRPSSQDHTAPAQIPV